MTINIKGVQYTPKYTFNSFRYMGDLDLSVLSEINQKPFMIGQFAFTLVMGAVNSEPSRPISEKDVLEFLENYTANNNLNTLLEELLKKLEESNFFKSLSMEQTKELPQEVK